MSGWGYVGVLGAAPRGGPGELTAGSLGSGGSQGDSGGVGGVLRLQRRFIPEFL